MSPPGGMGREEILWLLGSISGLYLLPCDAVLIAQQFSPPYSAATFLEATRSSGLKTGTVVLDGVDWQKLPLPAIAFLASVAIPGTNEIDVNTHVPVLIPRGLQVDEVFELGTDKARQMEVVEDER